jgi:Zn-dependent M28 family amino/carboxypeptidase
MIKQATRYKKSISKISSKLQSAKIAHKALKLKSTLKVNIEFISQDVFSENVLAYVPGSEKPEEYIFITAHYDHIGASNGEVYNGADDDGSGTVALLEIAQAFMEAKKAGMGPKRSVVFMAVSGEEKGLLGSEYYTDHPIVTLDQTVANLNIDMIGRIDDAHKDDTNYVYVIGADKLSSELHAINEKANEIAKLKLDYKYNDPKDPNMFYYRSDHYNFAKNNIPIIFYFNGVHEDYHKAGDEVSKIHFPMLAKRTQLVYLTAWELANRDNRIIVDKANDFPTK